MEEILQEILDKVDSITNVQKYEYDLLSAEKLSEETGINAHTLRKVFRDNKEKLGVQCYTKPWLVSRKKWNEFIIELNK